MAAIPELGFTGAALLTGALGDAVLQNLVASHPGGWGLKPYFAQHGKAESVALAAGLMGLTARGYVELFGAPAGLVGPALAGAVVDLGFRHFNVFPSLRGYYEALDPATTMVWGAIPMALAFMLFEAL